MQNAPEPIKAKTFDDLSSEQQSRVRVFLSGRVKVFLTHFWRPDDPSEIEEAHINDWVEVLKTYHTNEIKNAMHAYLARPDKTERGRAIRPGPWRIVEIITAARCNDPGAIERRTKMANQIAKQAEQAAQARTPVTREQAAAILAEHDFSPKLTHEAAQARKKQGAQG